MQKIRILLYTDHGEIVDQTGEPVGLKDLIRFIQAKAKGLFEVEITSINRHASLITKGMAQGANRLSLGLLSAYDELWIFGKRQINIPKPKELIKAEPYNELDDHEVDVIHQWMNNGGGLMVTGDHSETNPLPPEMDCDEPGHKSFLTLGRALGHRIPRARELRIWEGPPTNCPNQLDSVNTQVQGKCSSSLDAPCHQYDELPQTLLPLPTPHKLFRYVNSKAVETLIEVLPDHAHEGKVEVPKADKWPKNFALPVVAARGADKRPEKREEYDLVVAYDGHADNVGRIVADSSFHHFVDKNLMGIVGRDCCGLPIPDTHLDQIAHYFMNLVIWLAPPPVRNEIIAKLVFRLAKHPDVLEYRGSGHEDLGAAAKSVASAEWGDSNLFQLLGASPSEASSERFDNPISMAFFEESIPADLNEVPPQKILGSLVDGYHQFFRREQIYSPEFLVTDPTTPELIRNEIAHAFRDQPFVAERLVASFGSNPIQNALDITTKETITMAPKCGLSTWKSWIFATGSTPQPPFPEPPNDGFFDTDVVDINGNFDGFHRKLGSLRPIQGMCKETPHRIFIKRTDEQGTFHRYFGEISRVDNKDVVEPGNGRHQTSGNPFPELTDADFNFAAPPPLADDEWVAEKTT